MTWICPYCFNRKGKTHGEGNLVGSPLCRGASCWLMMSLPQVPRFAESMEVSGRAEQPAC